MSTEPVYVGIDVAKASLEVAVHPPADRWAVDYTDPAVATLVTRLTALAPALIVLEATGGLEGHPDLAEGEGSHQLLRKSATLLLLILVK